jgi:hypothetical protein
MAAVRRGPRQTPRRAQARIDGETPTAVESLTRKRSGVYSSTVDIRPLESVAPTRDVRLPNWSSCPSSATRKRAAWAGEGMRSGPASSSAVCRRQSWARVAVSSITRLTATKLARASGPGPGARPVRLEVLFDRTRRALTSSCHRRRAPQAVTGFLAAAGHEDATRVRDCASSLKSSKPRPLSTGKSSSDGWACTGCPQQRSPARARPGRRACGQVEGRGGARPVPSRPPPPVTLPALPRRISVFTLPAPSRDASLFPLDRATRLEEIATTGE